MSLSTDLIPISSLKVGAAGTVYPCTEFSRVVEVQGPDQTVAVAYRRERWTAVCHAQAAAVGDVSALWDTVRGHFCKRGERVTLTNWTGSRVLPEAGTPAASEERSAAGYPMVSIAEMVEQSYGTWITFRVEAEAVIPIVGAGNLVEHEYQVVESENEDGLVSLSQRGRVRVKNGQSARTWVEDNVIDAARTAAGTADHAFSVRYTQGLDAAAIEYEYTDADKGGPGGSSVSEARVEDRTSKTIEGRIVRVVSGYAEGTGATAWAESQEPAASASLLQTRRDISLPSVPDSRVTFAYEFLAGVEDAAFPGIYIFRYSETIEQVSGGREAVAQQYYDAAASIRLGTQAPYLYGQQTGIEFTGDWDDHGITCAFDDNYLARTPAIRKTGGQQGLRRVDMSFVIASPTPIDPLPNPRQIEAFA